MSYDLDLFVPQANSDPIDLIQNAAFSKIDSRTVLNIDIAQTFIADNPQFKQMVSADTIALIDSTDGIKIQLHSHTAGLSIPYWHHDERAMRLAFGTARRYLRYVLKSTNYAVYDPQLARVVDIEKDFLQMMVVYQQTIAGMQSFLG